MTHPVSRLLEQAIGEYLENRNAGPPAAQPDVPAPDPRGPDVATPAEVQVQAGPVQEWVDISTTEAGAAARERAIAEREAQGWLRHGVARLLGVRAEERAWRIGAAGEQAVAEQLAKLGPEWRVLHAVRVGERGADIDHVAVGPPGVFTINAKHHPNSSVWVGGDTFWSTVSACPTCATAGTRRPGHRAC